MQARSRGQWKSTWCRKAELSGTLTQNTKELLMQPVLHLPGCTQAEDPQRDSAGNLVMEAILETKTETILQFS